MAGLLDKTVPCQPCTSMGLHVFIVGLPSHVVTVRNLETVFPVSAARGLNFGQQDAGSLVKGLRNVFQPPCAASSGDQQLEAAHKDWRPWESQTGRHVKKKYGGAVSAVLEALSSGSDVEGVLAPWAGRLGSRDLSRVLNEQRDWHRAVEVFGWIKRQLNYRPNVVFYNIMFKVLGRAGMWGEVNRLWEGMGTENVEPTNVSFSTLIDACGRAGRREEALLWFEEMQGRGLEPDDVTVNTVINLHRRAGDLEAAEMVFSGSVGRSGETMRSGPGRGEDADGVGGRARDSAAYNTMIGMYGRAGHYIRASRVFADMIQAGVSPDVITFNTMIYICGCSGRRDEAVTLYKRMEEHGPVPDEATYNILISICAKEGEVGAAMEYLEKMKAAGLEPDAVTCRTLLLVTCDSGMVKETEDILEHMKQPEYVLGQAVIAKIVVMYIKAGLLADAERAQQAFHSAEAFSSKTFAVIINAYGEQGLWQDAEKVFWTYKETAVMPDVGVYNAMIKAYGLKRRWTQAVRLFDSLEEIGVTADEITFNSVIQMCASSGLIQETERILDVMRGRGFKPKQATYGAVLGLYGRSGQAKEAFRTFKQMQRDGISPDEVSYGALLNAFCEAGSVQDAKVTHEAMKRAGFSSNVVAYTSLLKVLGRLGMVDEARALFSEMQQLGFDMDVFVCNLMIDILGKAGFLDEAEKQYGQLERMGLANQVTMTIMLNLYKDADLLDQALVVAGRMQDRGLLKDLEGFYSVMGLYSRAGRLQAAAQIYLQMQEAIFEIGDTAHDMIEGVLRKAGLVMEPVDDSSGSEDEEEVPAEQEALVRSINIFALAGKQDEAVQACEQLRQGNFKLNVAAYNAMIYAYGTAGKFDLALRLSMDMQRDGLHLDVVTYTNIITVYGKMGLLEAVTRMFKRMKQNGCEPSAVTYSRLIDFYKEAGRLDLAAMVSHEMHFAEYLQQSHFPPVSPVNNDESQVGGLSRRT